MVFGAQPADAKLMRDAIEDLLRDIEGRSCVLHPRRSPFAEQEVRGAERRVIGLDLITMNSDDEEWAYREETRLLSGVSEALKPVLFSGVDLCTSLPALFDMRLQNFLIAQRAIERLHAEGFYNIIFWGQSFSSFDAALVAEQDSDRVLRFVEGRLVPQPALTAFHDFAKVGASVLDRFQTEAITVEDIIGGAEPCRSGLTVAILTSGASYLNEAESILASLEEAGVEYRLITLDENIAERLNRGQMNNVPAVLMPSRLETGSIDPARLAEALGLLYAQIERLLDLETGTAISEVAIQLLARARHTSVFRRAFKYCVQLERMAVWLDHDRTRCLFFYPSKTLLDPAPSQLMTAREGCDVRLILRSVTADYRNFYCPPTHGLLVLGEDQVRIARTRGFSGFVVPVGPVPSDSAFARWTRAAARSEVTLEALDTDKIVLVATSGFDRAGEARWLPQIAQAVRSVENAILIVKVHPSQDPSAASSAIQPDGGRVKLGTNMDIHPLIAAADVVLTDVSHVGKLAVLRGVPLGVMNFSGEPFPYNRFDEEGVAFSIRNESELQNFVDMLSTGGIHNLDEEARARYLRNEFGATDGQSGARLAGILRSLATDPTGSFLNQSGKGVGMEQS